jgi:peroxiredoxin
VSPLVGVTLVASWLIAGAALFLVFQLIRQNGRMLLRLEAVESQLEDARAPAAEADEPEAEPERGLALGTLAPPIELPDLSGYARSLSHFRGRKVFLVFFSPRCGYCLDLAPQLAELPWDADGKGLVPLIVTTGTVEENRKMSGDHGLRCRILLQGEVDIAAAYGAFGTPIGYLIDEEGRIASPMAVGANALMALAAEHSGSQQRGNKPLSESRLERDGLAVGADAPDFQVPSVAGGILSLSRYRGRQVLLVFSDPNCGPCDAVAPELERLAQERRDVQVLMISRGTVEENAPKVAEHGLSFPVGLQKKWEISRLYAMFGTPIAYLVDPTGKVAAEVAVGKEPILQLLRGAPTLRAEAPGAGARDAVLVAC